MNDLFLKACRGEAVLYTPVWLMRQAGRYMREYQAIRKKVDFLTLCKTPELAAEVTMQPVNMLGVDAAILFSDILVVVEAMGMEISFSENSGPMIHNPLRNQNVVEKLKIPDAEDSLHYVLKTIEILKTELKGRVPLIGFAGAPFTLATYMIEGGSSKNFIQTKKMMYRDPGLFSSLMGKITEMVSIYLLAQIKAGVQAVQLFDTWAGILSPEDFEKYAFPFVKQIISSVKNTTVPMIYFINNCSSLLEQVKTCGADVISLDWRIRLSDAVQRLGNDIVVQGNLDPCLLFGPLSLIEASVKTILSDGEQAKGHIFNLGHGILPETPVDNVKALVAFVHQFSQKSS